MTPVLFAAATKPDIAVFVVTAILVMGGAFGVVLFRNPVHCALSLITTLFGIAVAFVEQDAQFLAAVQVIVYAGAIVVLFLFVIMLLGVDNTDARPKERLLGQRPLAVILSLASLVLVVCLAGWSWTATGGSSQNGTLSGPGSNITTLADSIFTQYLLPFEATSVLLVIAVVGAVVLARKPSALPEEEPSNIDVGPADGDDSSEDADQHEQPELESIS